MTFLGTVFLDVDFGLFVGFGVSILTIVLRTQSPPCALLGQIPSTELYKDPSLFTEVLILFLEIIFIIFFNLNFSIIISI